MDSTSQAERGRPMPAEESRAAPTPSLDVLRSTFTHDAIGRLVSTFYARVREDPSLGPIFADRVTDWPRHLARMNAFWRSVLRAEPGYRAERGSPQEIHRGIESATLEHYARWLDLFEEVAREVFEPWAADHVTARARRMAAILSLPLRG